MLAQWLRERDQQKREERLNKLREEAAMVDAEWRAWYERMQTAQREGQAFDEPPPTAPQDKNGEKNP